MELANIFKANIIGLLVISLMLYLGGKNEYFHNFSRPMVFLFFGINLFAEILMRNYPADSAPVDAVEGI